MTVTVKLFARARDLAGAEAVRVALPRFATVSELRRALAEQFPSLRPIVAGLLVAVNANYAQESTRLTADSEVACFPPVSGG